MILRNFNYFRPQTIEEAQDLISSKEGAQIFSGGTFVIPFLKNQENFPKNIIGLKNIAELRNIEKKDGHILIGAASTLDEIKASNLIKNYFPILSEFIPHIATPQIRNMATIGGNISCGLPWADLAFLLLALDAVLEYSDKQIKFSDFLLSKRSDFLNKLLASISLPILNLVKYNFVRIPRLNSTDIPLAAICIIKTYNDIRVAVNLGNNFPKRFPKTEKFLAANDKINKIVEIFDEELKSFQRDEYRQKIISVNFKRLLEKYNGQN